MQDDTTELGSGAVRKKAIPDHPNVYRFLSGHSFDGGPPRGTTPPLVFMHIPKTGGTFLTDVILHNLQLRDQPALFYAPHRMNAADTARIFGPDRKLALLLRDPAARFVSAWHSRQRQGKPGYHAPWTRHEAAVFARYPELDRLLDDLGSLWPLARRYARRAIAGMTMVPRGYAHAFGSEAGAIDALPAIRLCLPIEALSDHLDQTMEALGFDQYMLPQEPAENRSTDRPPVLPDRLDTRLKSHLSGDYAIFRVLRSHAKRLHGW
ncbi:MAG: hypothetical protein AAGA19_09420 [Pseudomonadota bacterium]